MQPQADPTDRSILGRADDSQRRPPSDLRLHGTSQFRRLGPALTTEPPDCRAAFLFSVPDAHSNSGDGQNGHKAKFSRNTSKNTAAQQTQPRKFSTDVRRYGRSTWLSAGYRIRATVNYSDHGYIGWLPSRRHGRTSIRMLSGGLQRPD